MLSENINNLSVEDKINALQNMVDVLSAKLSKQAEDEEIEKILVLIRLTDHSILFYSDEQTDQIDYEHGKYVHINIENQISTNLTPLKVKELIRDVINQGTPILFGDFGVENRILSNDIVKDLNTI